RHAQGDEAPSGCYQIRLGIRVGAAPGGEPGEQVVASAKGSPIVRRANGDDVRVDAWRRDGVALRSAVPGRGHDDQTTAPRDFHGGRHRVGAVGKVGARAEGQVDAADVVGGAVRGDPLYPSYHRGDPAPAAAAEPPEVHDAG